MNDKSLIETNASAAAIGAHIDAGILTLTLARPRKKNALSGAMYDALRTHLQDATTNADVRVVLLHSSSLETFCAGNDIDGLAAVRDLPMQQRPGYRFMQTLAKFPKPIVAAVDGIAVGIGVTLLLHCDLVYAGNTATFRLPFVDVGLVPEFGSSFLLPRMAGYPKAAALLLLGEQFSAQCALDIGLIGEIVAHEAVLARAEAAAHKLAAKPSAALQASKRLLKMPLQPRLLRTIEREMETLSAQLQTPETQRILAGLLKKNGAKEQRTEINPQERDRVDI